MKRFGEFCWQFFRPGGDQLQRRQLLPIDFSEVAAEERRGGEHYGDAVFVDESRQLRRLDGRRVGDKVDAAQNRIPDRDRESERVEQGQASQDFVRTGAQGESGSKLLDVTQQVPVGKNDAFWFT